MGGKIAVDSTPGVGSKFSFEITFDLENAENETAEHVTIFGNRRPVFSGEVLLCEDNIMNQQVACEFLAKAGLETFIAENGIIGVEKVKSRVDNNEKQFDIIFMDVHMPVMDGLEATEKILMLDSSVPIIAMTANIMPDDVMVYIKGGMKECLGKPFVSHELWSCLMRYMDPVSWHDESEETGASPESFASNPLDRLEPLLKEKNIECISFINSLKSIPGSEKLIADIRSFNYDKALISLGELREKKQD